MRRLLSALCLVLLAALVSAAEARALNLPSGNPVMGIELPASWSATATKRGIEVRSPDGEVFFWVEIFLPADMDAVNKEHAAYFGRQGVEVVGQPKVSKNVDGKVKVQATDVPATWKGAPTVLRYLAIDPGLPAGNMVLISYWASPAGDKAHDAAFQSVLGSIGPPR